MIERPATKLGGSAAGVTDAKHSPCDTPSKIHTQIRLAMAAGKSTIATSVAGGAQSVSVIDVDSDGDVDAPSVSRSVDTIAACEITDECGVTSQLVRAVHSQ